MKRYILTLHTKAGDISRNILADSPFLAIISGMSMMQLPNGPFSISCKPAEAA